MSESSRICHTREHLVLRTGSEDPVRTFSGHFAKKWTSVRKVIAGKVSAQKSVDNFVNGPKKSGRTKKKGPVKKCVSLRKNWLLSSGIKVHLQAEQSGYGYFDDREYDFTVVGLMITGAWMSVATPPSWKLDGTIVNCLSLGERVSRDRLDGFKRRKQESSYT